MRPYIVCKVENEKEEILLLAKQGKVIIHQTLCKVSFKGSSCHTEYSHPTSPLPLIVCYIRLFLISFEK